jgi:type IV secretory pathway VirB2 component (pilin)
MEGMMNKLIDLAGHAASYLGVLVCLVAGVLRIFGVYDVAGFGLQSAFVMGVGLMVFACLAKLHVLSVRQASGGEAA